MDPRSARRAIGGSRGMSVRAERKETSIRRASEIIETWPEESREPAKLAGLVLRDLQKLYLATEECVSRNGSSVKRCSAFGSTLASSPTPESLWDSGSQVPGTD